MAMDTWNSLLIWGVLITVLIIAAIALAFSVQNREFADPATGVIRGVSDLQMQNGWGITTATNAAGVGQPWYGPEMQFYGKVGTQERQVGMFLKSAPYPNGMGVVFAGQAANYVVDGINKGQCTGGQWC